MGKIIDEIQEEIKREDFFNRLKKFFPFMVVGCLLLLACVGIYVWWENKHADKLYRNELIYTQALTCIQEGDFSKGRRLLNQLRSVKEFRFLVRLQKAYCDQADFQLTHSQNMLQKVHQQYHDLEKIYHSTPLQNFLTLAFAFFSIESSSTPVQDLSLLTTPQHTWYFLAAGYTALKSYVDHDQAHIMPSFALWNKAASHLNGGPINWLAYYSMLGAAMAQ